MEALNFGRFGVDVRSLHESTRKEKEIHYGQMVPRSESSNAHIPRPLWRCHQSQEWLPDKRDLSLLKWRSPAPAVTATTRPAKYHRKLESQPWQGGEWRLPSANCRFRRQGSRRNFQYGNCPSKQAPIDAGFLLPGSAICSNLDWTRFAVRAGSINKPRTQTGLAPKSSGTRKESAPKQVELIPNPGFLNGQKVAKSWGIVYNPKDKNIYVADRLEHSVLAFNLSGQLVRKFGSFGTNPEEFFRPAGVAIDTKRDRLLVSDKDNHRVVVYETNGKLVCLFGSRGYLPGQFCYPWGIDVSRDGSRVVVADSLNHRVQVFDGATYEFIAKFSVFETSPYTYKGSFDCPRDVLFDPSGKYFYVTDFNVNVVLIIDVNCTAKTILNTHVNMKHPQGMAWDNFGNLLVCDSSNNCIRVWSNKGQYIWAIPYKDLKPVNVAVLPNGKLAIADGMTGGLRFL